MRTLKWRMRPNTLGCAAIALARSCTPASRAPSHQGFGGESCRMHPKSLITQSAKGSDNTCGQYKEIKFVEFMWDDCPTQAIFQHVDTMIIEKQVGIGMCTLPAKMNSHKLQSTLNGPHVHLRKKDGKNHRRIKCNLHWLATQRSRLWWTPQKAWHPKCSPVELSPVTNL